MSILIYAESAEGKLKSSFWISFLCKSSRILGTTVTATVNAGDVSELSKYELDKIKTMTN
jgi:electron transfer flavoprotein alpha subunit